MVSAVRFLVEFTFSARYFVPVSCNDGMYVRFCSFAFMAKVGFGSEVNCQDFVAFGRGMDWLVLLETRDVELVIITELGIITAFDVLLVDRVALTTDAL